MSAHFSSPDPHTVLSQVATDVPLLDFSSSTPYPPPQTPLTSSLARSPTLAPTSPPTAPSTPDTARSPEQRRRDHHNTHTRRCRARLNWRFDALHAMLPPARNAEVRHKVHILDHAIAMLAGLRAENDRLHMLVALRADGGVEEWANTLVKEAPPADIVRAVLELLMFEGGWAWGEIWTVRGHGVVVQQTVVKGGTTTGAGAVQVGKGVAGRVVVHGRAEWCGEEHDMNRKELMRQARVRSWMAVPVPVGGHVEYVIVVYDVRDRARDVPMIKFAEYVCVTVGNCFGAENDRRRREEESTRTPKTPKAKMRTPKAAKLKA